MYKFFAAISLVLLLGCRSQKQIHIDKVLKPITIVANNTPRNGDDVKHSTVTSTVRLEGNKTATPNTSPSNSKGVLGNVLPTLQQAQVIFNKGKDSLNHVLLGLFLSTAPPVKQPVPEPKDPPIINNDIIPEHEVKETEKNPALEIIIIGCVLLLAAIGSLSIKKGV